ncbi:MAG TPA: hypothetical protein VGC32_13785 [Solirubrobacterales bacterium]
MKNLSRIRFLAIAAFAVSALGAQFVGSASAAPVTSSAWRSETLHYKFAHERCKLQRVPKGEAPAFGDGDICRYDILEGTKKIGHAGFSCGLVGPEEGVCDGTLVLPGGTLSSAGDLVDAHQIAISGGTGRFEGALGEWSYGTTNPSFTVHLLLPRL